MTKTQRKDPFLALSSGEPCGGVSKSDPSFPFFCFTYRLFEFEGASVELVVFAFFGD